MYIYIYIYIHTHKCHLLSYLDVIYLIYLTITVYPIKTHQTDEKQILITATHLFPRLTLDTCQEIV